MLFIIKHKTQAQIKLNLLYNPENGSKTLYLKW